jgi:hypothetical protein
MNAGTSILLIVLIFIAFGFVGSEYINTLQETRELRSEVGSLTQQLNANRTQLASCQDQSQKDEQLILSLRTTIDQLQTDASNLQHQVNELQTQNVISQLQGTIIDLLRSNPILLASALIIQITTLAIKHGTAIGLKFSGRLPSASDDYVRLSLEERTWLIRKRRIDRSRKANQ